MKTKELIACLNKQEYNAVCTAMVISEVPRWKLLCDSLRHDVLQSQKTDKQRLCQVVYHSSYDKSLDQKLRNDLRKINATIRDTIIAGQRQDERSFAKGDHLLWLEWVLSKERPSLFKKEHLLLKREKQRASDYSALAQLCELELQHLRSTGEISVRHSKVVRELIEQAIQFRKLEAAEHLLILELQRQQNDATIRAYLPEYAGSSQWDFGIDERLLNQEEVLRYLLLRARAYSLRGDEKIEILKELLQSYERVAKLRERHEQDIYALLGTIAIEHFLQSRFEDANHYYEIIFERYRKRQMKPHLEILYNYASNLFKGGHFEKVVELILKNYRRIKNNKRLRYRMEFFLVLSYLRLGESEQAYKELHINIHHRPSSEYLNFQFCYLIYYHQTGDFESFERSVHNLSQHVRRHPPYEEEYLYSLELVKQMLSSANLISEKHAKEQTQKLIARHEASLPSLKHFSIYSCLKSMTSQFGTE